MWFHGNADATQACQLGKHLLDFAGICWLEKNSVSSAGTSYLDVRQWWKALHPESPWISKVTTLQGWTGSGKTLLWRARFLGKFTLFETCSNIFRNSKEARKMLHWMWCIGPASAAIFWQHCSGVTEELSTLWFECLSCLHGLYLCIKIHEILLFSRSVVH